jgi:hypothetical protein
VAVLTLFAGRRLQKRIDHETPAPPSRILTFRQGYLTGARFASDGETIVYSAAWDGKPQRDIHDEGGLDRVAAAGHLPGGILAVSSQNEMAISLNCENRM